VSNQTALDIEEIMVPAFAPNIHARCECEIVDLDIDAPICTHFEPEQIDEVEGWESDICTACRHSERCHLKGYEPHA
jgi:hypothetical protein